MALDYIVKTGECSDFFGTELNNLIKTDLNDSIDKFKNVLNTLDGTNGVGAMIWKGDSAKTNVGKLIECFNEFLKIYNTLIDYLKVDVPNVFNSLNETFVTNKGTQLNISQVDASTFTNKTMNMALFEGEAFDSIALNTAYTDLVSIDDSTNGTLTKISSAMNKIGDQSEFFCTRVKAGNPAEKIKTDIQGYVSQLITKKQETLSVCITNLKTALDNYMA